MDVNLNTSSVADESNLASARPARDTAVGFAGKFTKGATKSVAVSAAILVASFVIADVPASPVLLGGDTTAAEPVVEESTDDPLRPYLRGNPAHGWERGQLGKPNEFWNTRVDQAPVAPNSEAVTTYLSTVSRDDPNDPSTEFFAQFDMGARKTNDPYSVYVLEADESTPRYEYGLRSHSTGFEEDQFIETHCDRIRMPVPAVGRVQGELSYDCTKGGDCHLYVVNSGTGQVFEQWRSFNAGPDRSAYTAGCTNVWELSQKQPFELRGLSCTSANAAGIPYVPMIFTPGDIKEGVIRHAIPFTTLNKFIKRDVYVRPATHNPIVTRFWGEHEPGPGEPMMYGSRFRLKASFEINPDWPPGLRVVLQALKDYGMQHIDGGPRMIIASNDYTSQFNWSDPDINLGPFQLSGISRLSWKDFELVSDTSQVGSMLDTSCTRTPINEF